MTSALRMNDEKMSSEQSQDMPWLASYAEGVPSSLMVPNVPLYNLLDNSAAQWPDRPALRTPQVVYDYASLACLTGSTAAGLQALGASGQASRSGCSCPIARRVWSCISPSSRQVPRL